jgi:hypothetical protein
MKAKGWDIAKYQTFCQLLSFLRRHGVKPARTVGDMFAQILAYIKDHCGEVEKISNFA